MTIKILKSHMRDVKILADAAPSVDKVSGFKFRSPEEVEFYIKQLLQKISKDGEKVKKLEKLFSTYTFPPLTVAALEISTNGDDREKRIITLERDPSRLKALEEPTVPTTPSLAPMIPRGMAVKDVAIEDKVTVPKGEANKIKEHFDVLESLQEKFHILDSLEQQVNHYFKEDKTKLNREIKVARVAVQKRLDQALKFISKIASKKQPKVFREVTDQLIEHYEEQLQEYCDDTKTTVYLTMKEDQNGNDWFYFTKYLHCFNLKHPEDPEFLYPDYIIAFTGEITPAARLRMYVSTHTKFRAPGTFKVGHPFSNAAEGRREIDALLNAEGMSDAVDIPPLPVAKRDIKLKRFGGKGFVESMDVEDNKIVLTLNSKVKEGNLVSVMERLYLDIRGLLEPYTKDSIKMSKSQTGKGRYVLTFKLALPLTDTMREKQLDAQKIKILKEVLHADDTDVKNVQRMFHKGY